MSTENAAGLPDDRPRNHTITYKKYKRIINSDAESAARQLAICQKYCEAFLMIDEGFKGKDE